MIEGPTRIIQKRRWYRLHKVKHNVRTTIVIHGYDDIKYTVKNIGLCHELLLSIIDIF